MKFQRGEMCRTQVLGEIARLRMLPVLLILGLVTASVSAGVRRWSYLEGGFWNQASNWNPAGVPAVGTDCDNPGDYVEIFQLYGYDFIEPWSGDGVIYPSGYKPGGCLARLTITYDYGASYLRFLQQAGSRLKTREFYMGEFSPGEIRYFMQGDAALSVEGTLDLAGLGGTRLVMNRTSAGRPTILAGGIKLTSSASIEQNDGYIQTYSFVNEGQTYTVKDGGNNSRYFYANSPSGTFLQGGNLAFLAGRVGGQYGTEDLLVLSGDAHLGWNPEFTWHPGEPPSPWSNNSMEVAGLDVSVGRIRHLDNATFEVQHLSVGTAGTGYYEMNGGRIDAAEIAVGHYGTGHFTQSGGTVEILLTPHPDGVTRFVSGRYGRLRLGSNHSGKGYYQLTGGTLRTTSSNVGNIDGGRTWWIDRNYGQFIQDGGLHETEELILAGDWFFNWGSDADSQVQGWYKLNGGTLRTTLSMVGRDAPDFEFDGQQLEAGRFIHRGGLHHVSDGLYLGARYGNGFYALHDSGELVTASTVVGSARRGVFLQDGGEHSVCTLTIASQSYPGSHYDLEGGTLVVGSIVNNGQFNYSGGNLEQSNTIYLGGTLVASGCGSLVTNGGEFRIQDSLLLAHDLLNRSDVVIEAGARLQVPEFTQEPGGNLKTWLAGGSDEAGLAIQGSAVLEGVLEVEAAGETPGLNDVYHLIDLRDATSIEGCFSQLIMPALAAGLCWDTSAVCNNGAASVYECPIDVNHAPLASAGPNRTISTGAIPTTVIRGKALDEDGDALHYMWFKSVSRFFDPVPLMDRSLPVDADRPAAPLELASVDPAYLGIGTHHLFLVVSEGSILPDSGRGLSARDDMYLTIENSAPTPVAGGEGIYESGQPFVLPATVSDPDGDSVNYDWNGGMLSETGSLETELGGLAVPVPDFNVPGLAQGAYEFVLTVDDGINPPVQTSVRVKVVDELLDGCDGSIEGRSREITCGVGACAGSTGTETCRSGRWVENTCNPLEGAAAEECDNVDNNCDGAVDEGLERETVCSINDCVSTVIEYCEAGEWKGDTCEADPADCCVPNGEEVCDGLDNDCDGMIDEIVTEETTCGQGVCSGNTGRRECQGGTLVDTCDPFDGAIPLDAACNGYDDDCDGAVDEDYVGDSTCFLPGACAAENMPSSCVNGEETPCSTGIPEADDATCNAVDEDCDGDADEDYTPDDTCFLPGACAAGNQASSCVEGVETDCSTGTPEDDDDTCDAVDEDCDGDADEDYKGAQTSCGAPGPCEAVGETSCVEGAVVDSCDVTSTDGFACGDQGLECMADDFCLDGSCSDAGVEACGRLTDGGYCPFDREPDLGLCVDTTDGLLDGFPCAVGGRGAECGGGACYPSNQFRVLFGPDVQDWVSYKLNASNPGQFRYNAVIEGESGQEVPLTVTIPYPFVTQGARPLNLYDGADVGGEAGCFLPPEDANLGAYDLQITLDHWLNGVRLDDNGLFGLTCDQTCGLNSDPPAFCSFTVNLTFPDSGIVYLTLHLDYGLKGPHVDADCAPGEDRYDRAPSSSPWGSADALENNDMNNGEVAVPDLGSYIFRHSDGMDSLPGDEAQNLNIFKPIAGAFGRVSCVLTGDGFEGRFLRLVAENGNGVTVGSSDEDGYYSLPYKHKGKPAFYTIEVYDRPQGTLLETVEAELQGNGWAEINFEASMSSGACGQNPFEDWTSSVTYGAGRNKNK